MILLIIVIFIIAQVDLVEIKSNQLKEVLDQFFEKETFCDYYSNDLEYGILILWDEEEKESIISVSSVGNEFIPYTEGFQVNGILYYNNHRFFVRTSNHKKTQEVYFNLFRAVDTCQIEYTQNRPGYFANYGFAYETFKYNFYEFKSLGSTHSFKCGLKE